MPDKLTNSSLVPLLGCIHNYVDEHPLYWFCMTVFTLALVCGIRLFIGSPIGALKVNEQKLPLSFDFIIMHINEMLFKNVSFF